MHGALGRRSTIAFAWRGELGIARWGWAELMVMGLPLLALTIGLARHAAVVRWRSPPGIVLRVARVVLSRSATRTCRREPGLVVSPADGKIAEITQLEHHEFVGGPAVRIGIFLSIFNVHLNRSPLAARVVAACATIRASSSTRSIPRARS